MSGIAKIEHLQIGMAMDSACETLPEGWQICIDLECGCGSVSLYDNKGNEIPLEFEGFISEQILNAIEVARSASEGSSS